MPANTQTIRRHDRATTTNTTDRHSTPASESTALDGEDVVSAEQSEASTDAPSMFGSADVVLPNLFDRNNELVAPDME